MRNQTYNEIIKYLREFANQHMDVMRFEEEDEDQMSSITSMDEKFPMMFVTPTGAEYNYDLNNYSLRIYCYDRLTKDRENNTNIRSKTNQILNDLDVWLRKESTLPFEIDDTTSVTPFSSELMTDVTGWYIDVVIDNPSFSVCEIPFKNIPLLPLGPCDSIEELCQYYIDNGYVLPDYLEEACGSIEELCQYYIDNGYTIPDYLEQVCIQLTGGEIKYDVYVDGVFIKQITLPTSGNKIEITT